MEAKDLMIGDWVQGCPPDTYSRIYGIFNEERVAIITSDTATYLDISIEVIQPIPLTSEILEKNGFVLNWWWRLQGEDLWLANSGDKYRVYANEDDDKRDNFCWISYVHELQHVLRLRHIDKEIVL